LYDGDHAAIAALVEAGVSFKELVRGAVAARICSETASAHWMATSCSWTPMDMRLSRWCRVLASAERARLQRVATGGYGMGDAVSVHRKGQRSIAAEDSRRPDD
jgi:hypothetical protein